MPYDPILAGADCFSCPLRGQTVVPPEGNMYARIAIVGEAPGANEEISGRPFIGASGRLLDEILKAVGVERSEVWITNALLCRSEVPDMKGTKRFDLPTYLAWIRAQNKQRKKLHQPEIKSPLTCCKPRLMWELKTLDERAIAAGAPNGLSVIPVGNFGLEATTGKKGITKWRGSPIDP